MAEGGPPGPQPQQQRQPAPQQHPIPPQPAQQVNLHMNWSHFKPEYSGKPEEDIEVHLLRTNDWMNTHDFPHAVKVQRFCLMLMGEARLWYASLEPIEMTWQELQNQVRRQYSKLGNTREQLFHVWRSFHYDENVEIPDICLTKEKIDRQLTGQSSTPFMKLSNKKSKKAVSFDARDVLERNSENMERMTAFRDKMFIKLDQKDVLYKPQIYQKRGRGQNR